MFSGCKAEIAYNPLDRVCEHRFCVIGTCASPDVNGIHNYTYGPLVSVLIGKSFSWIPGYHLGFSVGYPGVVKL